MKDKPVREKKNLDKGLKRSVGKPACCVSKGGSSSNTTSLPNLFLEVSVFDVLQPVVGDTFSIGSCRYRVHSPPLRDNSGIIWKIQGVP